MSTQAFISTLTVTDCPRCGVVFGLSAEYERRRREDHETFYCPSGHPMSYGKSAKERELEQKEREIARLRNEAQWQSNRADSWRESAEGARRQAAAHKGVATRLKRRVAAGACPCCRERFPDLQQQLAERHPEFVASAEGAR